MLVVCLLPGLVSCSVGTRATSGEITGQETASNESDKIEDTTEKNQGESDAKSANTPTVLVDIGGYCPGDEKTVFFLDGEDGETFYVVDADTRQTVYEGIMTEMSEENQEDGVCLKGNFSSVTQEGNYYIEAAHVGRSYTFPIEDGHFETIADRLLTDVMKETENKQAEFLDRTQALAWLLRYQEYTEDADTLAENLTEAGNQLLDERPEEMDAAEMAFYCGTMAQLYQMNKESDARGAAVFLKEAERIYLLLDSSKQQENFDEVWLFYDAAALYQVTGYAKYYNVIKTYLDNREADEFFAEGADSEQLLKDEAYIYGAIAYLKTVFRVDTNLCSELMQELTDQAENMQEEQHENPFLCVSADQRNRLLADRLYIIAVVEHVIVSKEYVQIMEDGIHYINGCNETGQSFVGEDGVYDSRLDEKDSSAVVGGAYLFVLREIIENGAAQ
jgi:hypothetical protein